jgi:hypothetical protein
MPSFSQNSCYVFISRYCTRLPVQGLTAKYTSFECLGGRGSRDLKVHIEKYRDLMRLSTALQMWVLVSLRTLLVSGKCVMDKTQQKQSEIPKPLTVSAIVPV